MFALSSSSDSLWYETPHQIRASKRFFRHLGRVGRYEAVMQSRTSGGLKPAYWPSHNHVVTYCLPSFHTNIMNSLFSFRWNFDISFCNFWHFTIVHTYHILLESSWKVVLSLLQQEWITLNDVLAITFQLRYIRTKQHHWHAWVRAIYIFGP